MPPSVSPSDLAARYVIPVFNRQRYGYLDTWPADETQARHLFTLTGNRTLSHAHRCALEALGFTFETVPDPSPPRVR